MYPINNYYLVNGSLHFFHEDVQYIKPIIAKENIDVQQFLQFTSAFENKFRGFIRNKSNTEQLIVSFKKYKYIDIYAYMKI